MPSLAFPLPFASTRGSDCANCRSNISFSRIRISIRFWISIISTLHSSTSASSFVMREMMSSFFWSKSALLPLAPGLCSCSFLPGLRDLAWTSTCRVYSKTESSYFICQMVCYQLERGNIHRLTRHDHYYRTYRASFQWFHVTVGNQGCVDLKHATVSFPSLNQINNLQHFRVRVVRHSHAFRWDRLRVSGEWKIYLLLWKISTFYRTEPPNIRCEPRPC